MWFRYAITRLVSASSDSEATVSAGGSVVSSCSHSPASFGAAALADATASPSTWRTTLGSGLQIVSNWRSESAPGSCPGSSRATRQAEKGAES